MVFGYQQPAKKTINQYNKPELYLRIIIIIINTLSRLLHRYNTPQKFCYYLSVLVSLKKDAANQTNNTGLEKGIQKKRPTNHSSAKPPSLLNLLLLLTLSDCQIHQTFYQNITAKLNLWLTSPKTTRSFQVKRIRFTTNTFNQILSTVLCSTTRPHLQCDDDSNAPTCKQDIRFHAFFILMIKTLVLLFDFQDFE